MNFQHINRPTTHNKSLILNNVSSTQRSTQPAISHSTTYRPPPPTFYSNKSVSIPGHHKSLVINNNSTPNNNSSSNSTSRVTSGPHRSLIVNNNYPSTSLKTPLSKPSRNKKLILRSTPGSTIQRYRNNAGQSIVVIDGISFIAMGKRLIRQDLDQTGKTKSNVPRVLIRRLIKKKKVRYKKRGNAVYIRQPDGYERQGIHGKTLVLKDSQQGKRYCGTFTRYGTCPNKTRCGFIHDPNHRAACVSYLFTKTCRHNDGCRHSHHLTPENVPHCRHFQRIRCTNDDCPFQHVRVRPDAPLCRAFGVEGYCPKGLTCKQQHIIVCPTFAVLGKCSKPKCPLPHVNTTNNKKATLKAKQQWIRPQSTTTTIHKKTEQQQQEEEEDGFVPLLDDDNTDWNQYLIKNPMDDIKSLRFNEEEEEEEDNEDSSNNDTDDEIVYEEISDNEDDDDNSSMDNGSMEEIFEEVSDMEDDDE
ncbi:uncharacterized protein BX664DRAFT_270981 [Halteromyces radiatus]|uniref:uncharacterized protein n=1 Tax=Halteromyces radiatus TaxID=101107 RepID=UPI00221E92C3|nr:uncharacterized protein BX664DRAFT_270981 [Halteromyces radiatus]KAI8076357.1 hypothetical protein BX664DRAFT_270981 [Halteromyces radiatus]